MPSDYADHRHGKPLNTNDFHAAVGIIPTSAECQYHHTWVHRHDLTATVTAFDVTWQT